MKRPDSFLTNTTAPAGRALGAAKNNPGDDSGTGMDKEIYNDPAYAALAIIESYKDGGNTDSDETTVASDARDAIEELTDKRVTDSVTPANTLAEWVSGTTYVVVGELLTHKGFQFVAYNVTGNLAKDPLTNPDFWHLVPKPDELLDRFNAGRVCPGGMSDMADRAGGNYQQNIEFGRYRLGGNGDDFYNFFRVALDGSVVTGDATLEAIFDVGGGAEYPYLDIYAPDVAGTRTLLDMGGRTTRAQSVSGKADTIGELQEDAMQRITGLVEGSQARGYFDLGIGGVFTAQNLQANVWGGATAATTYKELDFDSANSISPNAAKTDDDETRMAAIVEGGSYIITMQTA